MKIKNNMKQSKLFQFLILASAGIFILGTETVFADPETGTAGFDNFITFICGWLIRIGMVVALIGGVQMAIGFKQDDPDAKVRGAMTLAAGFMVVGIGSAPSLFGF